MGVTYLDKVTNDYIRESREIHEIGQKAEEGRFSKLDYIRERRKVREIERKTEVRKFTRFI